MLALGLVFAILAYATFVGLALLTFATPRRDVSIVLAAPAIGLCAIVVPLFWLSDLGLPIGRVAAPLFAVTLIASLVALRGRLRAFEWRAALVPSGIATVGVLLTAWPMFAFGFQWLSYGNDDMTNYVLDAQRLVSYGFLQQPGIDAMTGGTNAPATYWNFAVTQQRPGSQLLLAFVAALTGLKPLLIFMPTIVAIYGALIACILALIYVSAARRNVVIAVAFLLSASALGTFGTEYQLIGQQYGSLTVAAAVFACTRVLSLPGAGIRDYLLPALMVVAGIVVYPELVPFWLLPVMTYHLIRAFSEHRKPAEAIVPLLMLGAVSALFANVGLRIFVGTQLTHLGTFSHRGLYDDELFPYYLVPSGLANFFGLTPIALDPAEPWMSLCIFVAIVLCPSLLVATITLCRKNEPVALVTVVYLAAVAVAAYQRNGFPLYKLAMYIEPFLWPTICLWWWRGVDSARFPRARAGLVFAPLVLLAIWNASVQWIYVSASAQPSSGFNEVRGGSGSHVADELSDEFRSSSATRIVSDMTNKVLDKVAADFSVGKVYVAAVSDFFAWAVPSGPVRSRFMMDSRDRSFADDVDAELQRNRERRNFTFFSGQSSVQDEFLLDHRLDFLDSPGSGDAVLVGLPQQSVFNRRQHSASDERNTALEPLDDVHNDLAFTYSALGHPYFERYGKRTAIFQLENDYFYPGGSMAAFGRYLLFRVIKPTPMFRFEMWITDSLQGDGSNALPHALVQGARSIPFALTGRGSARVFSSSLSAAKIAGHPFIGLDMGRYGKQFGQHRHGLNALYGRSVALDFRYVVGFARDMSLVSDDEYARMRPPSTVDRFPQSLANPDLEYSGIYEDGWLSESSYLRLLAPPGSCGLNVRGFVPQLGEPTFASQLTLRIDGRVRAAQKIGLGNFTFDVPVRGGGIHTVALDFSRFQRLPGADGRPVAAKLTYAGFTCK